jgi:hypothetical protein
VDVEGGNEVERGRDLKRALAGIGLFSARVLRMPLYDYQLAPLEAVLASVREGRGRDFLLVFPRQSGKNEAVAHLLVYLLNLLRRHSGQIVYAAIGDGIGRGLQRLEARLDNDLNRGKWRRGGQPLRRSVGRASVVFASSHPSAFGRGETAHWLLVVDELQDQDAAHLEAVFEPMRAANNATALYLGTVRSRHDALWQKKEALERLEAADGVRRVFMVTPEMVIAANPRYGAFLAARERQLGRLHPIVQSEYYLRPLDGEAGLFPPRRRALMLGSHPRQHGPRPGQLIVATLDLAGQDEAATDAVARLASPGRDYTVCTIFQVKLDTNGAARDSSSAGALPIPVPRSQIPVFLALDVFVDHGSRHFQDAPGRPALVRRLLAYLQQWQASHLIADATGVGEGVVDWLAAALGPQRVTPFKFTAASKARLGSRFLTLVETGRFQYWRDAPAGPQSLTPDALSDSFWFWQQVAACSYDLPPGGAFERHLRWGVPAGATVETALGRQPLHDDRLLSAALIAHADALIAAGTLRLGSGQSVVIGPAEPVEGW